MKLLSVLRSQVRAARTRLLGFRYPGLSLGKGVLFRGSCLIQIHPEAQVVLGDQVVINSRNSGYHLNMHSAVKLMADRPGARISIGPRTRIHGTCLHAYSEITIGANCLIAANCQIFDGNGHRLAFDQVEERIHTTDNGKPIRIGDNVWIGANVLVLPGVSIGSGSVVSAGSVVRDDVPPLVVVAGNPAQVILTADQWRAHKAEGASET